MLAVTRTMNDVDNEILFQHFRNWVISLGSTYYHQAIENIEIIFHIDDPRYLVVGEPNFKDIDYVASVVC